LLEKTANYYNSYLALKFMVVRRKRCRLSDMVLWLGSLAE
jgi:hypothetical protein